MDIHNWNKFLENPNNVWWKKHRFNHFKYLELHINVHYVIIYKLIVFFQQIYESYNTIQIHNHTKVGR